MIFSISHSSLERLMLKAKKWSAKFTSQFKLCYITLELSALACITFLSLILGILHLQIS